VLIVPFDVSRNVTLHIYHIFSGRFDSPYQTEPS